MKRHLSDDDLTEESESDLVRTRVAFAASLFSTLRKENPRLSAYEILVQVKDALVQTFGPPANA